MKKTKKAPSLRHLTKHENTPCKRHTSGNKDHGVIYVPEAVANIEHDVLDCENNGNEHEHGDEMSTLNTLNHWMHDVHMIFQSAMQRGNYAVALRCKALMAQANGWLHHKEKNGKDSGIKPVHQWTPQEVQNVLDQLEMCEGENTSS